MLFKKSKYISIIDSEISNVKYIYSFVSENFIELNKDELNLFGNEEFELMDKGNLERLVEFNIIEPLSTAQDENYRKELLLKDKLIIVLDLAVNPIEIEDLYTKISIQEVNKLCILLVLKNYSDIFLIKDFLVLFNRYLKQRSFTKVNVSYLILDYSDYKHKSIIYILKPNIKKKVIFDKIYTHYLLKDKSFNNFTSLSEDSNFGYSSIGTDVKSTGVNLKTIVKPKKIDNCNIVLSNEKIFKELPLSGFIIDYDRLDLLSNFSHNTKCFECKYLLNCGGYIDKEDVYCPSYINDNDWILNKITILIDKNDSKGLNSSIGISNSLILQKDIIYEFERMIFSNSDELDILNIKYLSKKYNKAFGYVKNMNLTKAEVIFNSADGDLKNLFNRNSFQYKYSQTFATSTKSFLKFKENNKTQAISMTQEGIEYAIDLQNYPSTDIVGLFISQMLMNLSKIYLLNGEFENWYETTLMNINLLLNFKCPSVCEGYNTSNLKEVSSHLRYFMLIEVINKALMSIIKYKLNEGKKLIKSIKILYVSDDFSQQIKNWVELNILLDDNEPLPNSTFVVKYNDFIGIKNTKYDFRILKQFIKNRIRKENVVLNLNLVKQ